MKKPNGLDILYFYLFEGVNEALPENITFHITENDREAKIVRGKFEREGREPRYISLTHELLDKTDPALLHDVIVSHGSR